MALAERSGRHQTCISLLKHGERSPKLDTAKAIASALGFSLGKLPPRRSAGRTGGAISQFVTAPRRQPLTRFKNCAGRMISTPNGFSNASKSWS